MRKNLLLILVLLGFSSYAQKASIKRVEIAGDKIIVHYDLEANSPADEFQINLYSSQSNFATALTKVRGDVGNEVKAGPNKRIEWSILEELGPYKGKLSLEIRGRTFVPVAKINNLSAGDKLKRGKNHIITWKPGNSNPVNIELLKGDRPVDSHLNQANNGTFSIFIPPHMVVGKDYSLRITDTKDSENAVISQPFAVTRKVPLLLKAVPILAVGGVVAVLAAGGDGGGGGENRRGQIELPAFPGNN